MTLNEGIKLLMLSKGYNTALVHKSWTDGQYIQVSSKFVDGADQHILVLSKIDSDRNYSETNFSRKYFQDIKNDGWEIISAKGLCMYAHKVTMEDLNKPIKVDVPINLKKLGVGDVMYLLDILDERFPMKEFSVEEKTICYTQIKQIFSEMCVPKGDLDFNKIFEDGINQFRLAYKIDKNKYPNLYKVLFPDLWKEKRVVNEIHENYGLDEKDLDNYYSRKGQKVNDISSLQTALA